MKPPPDDLRRIAKCAPFRLEGRLNQAGHFDATNIMAKCPSKYEMKERAKKGERAPHAEVSAAGVQKNL